MIGSEKQVLWATSIRERVIVDLAASMIDPQWATSPALLDGRIAAEIEWLREVESAAWWIDRRSEPSSTFCVIARQYRAKGLSQPRCGR